MATITADTPKALFLQVQPPAYERVDVPPANPTLRWVKVAAALGDHAEFLQRFFAAEAIEEATTVANRRHEWEIIDPILTGRAVPPEASIEAERRAAALEIDTGEFPMASVVATKEFLAVRSRRLLGGLAQRVLSWYVGRPVPAPSAAFDRMMYRLMQAEAERRRNEELIAEHFATPPPEFADDQKVIAAAALACQATMGVTPGICVDAADVLFTDYPHIVEAAVAAPVASAVQ